MESTRKKILDPPSARAMVENIVGCKWSLAVIAAVRQGTKRPGAMQRVIDGISTKVLNERLAKMVRYGILSKTVYQELPPRVEYDLTAFGNRFSSILDQVEALQADLESEAE